MRYFLSFLFGWGVCLLITPVVRRVALKMGVVDRPRGLRKIHDQAVPLLGGIAVYLTFIAGVVFFLKFGIVDATSTSFHDWWLVLIGGLAIIVGGILDDIFDLPPVLQFIFPLLATVTVIFGGVKVAFVGSPFGGILHLPGWFGLGIAAIWLLGLMYTTKFLDGLDGLVCGVTAIASVVIFIVSLFWDDRSSATGVLALLVAGISVGFLRLNFYPAKIFLGEGGSVFLGYVLGILSIISGSKIATAMLVMALPIIDTLWVIVKRLKQGRSPVLGDRKHFHFRLLDRGWSQTQVVIFMYGVTLIYGITGLFLGTRGKVVAIIVIVITTTWLISFFYTPMSRRSSRRIR